jgi:hypothetical protein
MKAPRYGVDSEKGKFYLFDLTHAEQVVRLLVENSYVRFGSSYYHQVCGIPMGINPAVFMANYYLFFYEFSFVRRLTRLVVQYPRLVSQLPDEDMTEMLQTPSEPAFSADQRQHIGDVAYYILRQFRFVVRFVDDLTSGPNRLLKHLL